MGFASKQYREGGKEKHLTNTGEEQGTAENGCWVYGASLF